MHSAWDSSTGLVSSPPVGDAPENFWANVECAFLNTHQARWQLFVDELGMGFAQGKNLMFRKSALESIGGIATLAQEPAEDAAATKAIRAAGLKVRLARAPFAQPLGTRSLSELWKRQVRWARLRRTTFPLLYLPEIFSGSFLPTAAAVVVAWRTDSDTFLTIGSLLLMWYGSELILARHMRWHLSLTSPIGMVARDLILPLIWVAGLISNSFEWQGHQMSAKQKTDRSLSGVIMQS